LYILQESLFSFEELQILESKEKLPIFFSALDLRPYAKQLKRGCPKSRLNRPSAQPFFLFLGYKKIVLFYRMKLTKKHSKERTISYE